MTDEERIKLKFTATRLYENRAAKNAEILRIFFANKPNGKLKIYNLNNNYLQPLIT